MKSAIGIGAATWHGPRDPDRDMCAPVDHCLARSEDRDRFARNLEAQVPALLRHARRRAGGHSDLADDLVQETLLRAWANQDRFLPGTNLSAWLFVILRNAHISIIRKHQREQIGLNEGWEDHLAVAANQEVHVELTEVLIALNGLAAHDRGIMRAILVDCSSHREIALLEDCALGTVRSRLSRARKRLAQKLL